MAQQAESSRSKEQPVDVYVDGLRYQGYFLSSGTELGRLRIEGAIPGGVCAVVGFRTRSESVFVIADTLPPRARAARIIHLIWRRAETRGSPDMLAEFLAATFGLFDCAVRRVGKGDHSTPRSVFVFPEPESEETQDMPPVHGTGDGTASEAALLPEATLSLLSNGSEPRGVLTTLVSRGGLRAPCSVPARVRICDRVCDGRILFLSASGLFIQVEDPPESLPQESRGVPVRFALAHDDHHTPVRCLCHVLAVDDGLTTGTPGLDLEFVRLDDGADGAALKSYVRWLHLQALTSK